MQRMPADNPTEQSRDHEILVLNDAQRDAMTQSMVRLEITDAISDLAPCSIAELATELGRSPQSLYYHIDILCKVELIEQVGTRKTGRRDEALYDLASKWMRFVDNNDPKRQEVLLKLNQTVIRMTEKDYRNAFNKGYVARINGVENVYFRRQRGRLTDADVRKVYEHIEAIGKLLQDGNEARRGNLYSISLFLSPLEARENDAVDDK